MKLQLLDRVKKTKQISQQTGNIFDDSTLHDDQMLEDTSRPFAWKGDGSNSGSQLAIPTLDQIGLAQLIEA